MRKDNGWEHLGELSRLLQVFRSIYLHSNAEDDDNAIVEWRSDVRLFFMVSIGVVTSHTLPHTPSL